MKLENVFTSFMTRVTRIAYLQGMKDFAELCGLLKCDTNEILEKHFWRDELEIRMRIDVGAFGLLASEKFQEEMETVQMLLRDM